jgi:tripartite-type tricarboxylate transporter receptor subunit TctC
MRRRQFLHLAAGAAALPAMSGIGRAQTWPTRPISMIVPFPPGSPTDVVGRVMIEHMKVSLGQPIIIENIGGADGNIGTARAARAKPDGYTICLGDSSTHMMSGALYSLQYDVLNDFAPISLLVSAPTVFFARKTMPANNVKELIVWLKANPNKASAGMAGASYHMVTALFQKETGTQCALSWERPCGPGLGSPPNRYGLHLTGPTATGAGWEYKGICGDKRHALRAAGDQGGMIRRFGLATNRRQAST